MSKTYTIRKASSKPVISSLESFTDAEEVEICEFRKEGSVHTPKTKLKLVYNANGLHGLFNVKDQYVKSVSTGYQSAVCRDSCVELFLKPSGTKGYFNFEFNCGGAILSSYITDHTRTEDGFAEYEMLDIEDLKKVEIYHSLPEVVESEVNEPVEWQLGFYIPFSIIAKFAEIDENLSGVEWSGNFYKCGDDTSHPHWASWAPLSECNFHLPECFGKIIFE